MEKGSLISGSEVVKLHRDLLGKELPEIGLKLFEPTGSWFEENKIKCCLEERAEILSKIRIERDNLLSLAEWDPVSKKAIFKKKKGKCSEVYGHHMNNNDYLYPEEALFLLETNSLLLFHGEMHVSIEMAYCLLLNEENGCTLDKYRVFSYLSRLGYKVIKHSPPSTSKKLSNPQKVCKVREEVQKSPQIVQDISTPSFDDIITIDDSSSDSSSDDVVYLETTVKSVSDAIVLDDDSRDSIIIIGETKKNVEILDLKEWPFIYWKKFLLEDDEEKENSNQEEQETWIGLKKDLIEESDDDILKRIPNIKNKVNYLHRPDLRLLPQGVRPIHQKYLINLSRGRGFTPGRRGFRGFRGSRNNHFGVRQSQDMRSVAMNMLRYASIILGGGLPPGSFGNQLLWSSGFSPRRFNNRNHMQRGGRRPFRSNRGRFYSSFEQKNTSSLTVVISDDEEESSDSKRGIKRIAEDISEHDSKKIALETLSPSIKSDCSSNSVKMEVTSDSVEMDLNPNDVKTESNVKTESSNPSLKSDTLKIETDSLIKVESNKEIIIENSNIKMESEKVEINDGNNINNKEENGNNKVKSKNIDIDDQTNMQNRDIPDSSNKEVEENRANQLEDKTIEEASMDETVTNTNKENLIKTSSETMDVENCCTKQLEDSNQDLERNNMQEDEVNLIECNNKTINQEQCANEKSKVSNHNDNNKTSCCNNNSKESNPHDDTPEGNDSEVMSKTDEEDKMEEEFEYGQSIIQPHHCFSMENVFSTLQIFEGFDGDPRIEEKELSVVYDIYLPNAPFRKSSPEPPNFRLIIIGLDDPMPSANQMFKLKSSYQDRVQFLFAIVLKESVAFYLYDNISLPSDFK